MEFYAKHQKRSHDFKNHETFFDVWDTICIILYNIM